MKRFISLFLAMMLFLSVACTGYAAEMPEVQPRYKYIASLSASMLINSSTGISTCSSFVKTDPGYDVNLVCKLQKYNGTTWENVKIWQASGNAYANISELWAVYSYYDYRVYVSAFVYDKNGTCVETATNIDYADYV